MKVLLLGATGRTGALVLAGLTSHQIQTVCVTRSPEKLLAGGESGSVRVVQSSRSDDPAVLDACIRECDTVVSCIGHVASLHGMFREGLFVRDSARAVVEAAVQAKRRIRFIHLGTAGVSVDQAGQYQRGWIERAFIAGLHYSLVPMRDSQATVDYLAGLEGTEAEQFVEWTVVRPDWFQDGDVSPYLLDETIQSGIFAGETSRIANIADFIGKLVRDSLVWETWKGKMPVIRDAK